MGDKRHGLSVAGVALAAIVGCLHARLVLTHFSSDAYLCDSGWIAFLFEAADPLLRNPSGSAICATTPGIERLSFYAHHLSPHIFVVGALGRAAGLNGFTILALHQGVAFAAIAAACWFLAAGVTRPLWLAIAGLVSATAIGTLGNVLWQAAAYPHYETAMFAVTTVAMAAWVRRAPRLWLACLIWLPLIREDGGLYAAIVCLCCAAIARGRDEGDPASRRTLIVLAMAGLGASGAAFAIKAHFFPGFDAFAYNFAGDSWRHVSRSFLVERIRATLTNGNVGPVLLGCLLLGVRDPRYALGLLLLAPVYLLHVLSVRPEHGGFTLYYALPWVVTTAVWLMVFVERTRRLRAGAMEAIALVTIALVLSAPAQAAFGLRGSFWYVARWSVSRPVANLESIREFVRSVRRLYPPGDANGSGGVVQCVSAGIGALIPNEVRASEIVMPGADLSTCQTLLLMRGDMHHGPLAARAEAQSFVLVSERQTAELWMVRRR
jgi:hypothetical protein